MPKRSESGAALLFALSVCLPLASRDARAESAPSQTAQPAAHFSGLTIFARSKPRLGNQVPVVVVKETTVGPAGPIDEALLRRIFIKQSQDALRGCYLRALQDAPALSGVLSVRFVIAKSGNVESAEVASGLAKALDNCVIAEVRKASFPKPAGGPLTVNYPFAFKPDSA